MGHPWSVFGTKSRTELHLLHSTLLLLFSASLAAQTTAQAALSSALRATPAVGVVLDVKSGRLVAAVRSPDAATKRSAPGSILKPFFLTAALRQREVLPQTTIFCRRNLHIREGNREWNLACTHPQGNVAFTAKEALAYSCNQYFAALADRIPPGRASAILKSYGLAQAPHLFAGEAWGTVPTPESQEQKELMVLGIAGITVSPAQMAVAYRKLALELHDARAPFDTVREGLKDSVDYGMAHNAAVPGVEIAGKTGTASDPGQSWSHGWFAGTGDLDRKEYVVVIYLPRGNGADAAHLAQHFFLAMNAPTACGAPGSAP
jgi:cell division protein FtsI/penicillin-binding protein 2